ncbi:MAG TPA: serine hydrolase [Candidatus Omnitrophota bacterium]|nr:serine hydrolase [Candidatus Omnitrophota bacterium]HPN87787.1 serine hydrolase [Candidatus Omnitrophota bacterium]
MNKKILGFPLFILFFLFGLSFVAQAYRVSCRSVIFSDATKGKRIYGKNVSLKVLPASTTKVMTALIVLERLSLDEYVTVHKTATYVQPTKLNLRPGEEYRVADLLHAAIVNSANDASVVLAEAVAGSEWQFVQLMNRRAKQLGAKNTRFANSHGLPTKKGTQYTTAYDMYLIFHQALQHAFFKQSIRLRHKTIYSKEGRALNLKSHNKILFKSWDRAIYGKTGYTRRAGACFVGTLQEGKRTLIIGVFNCPNRWDDIKYIVSTFGNIPL